MDDSFHFALLRISIAQILKANGFDKCKPSVLNILTDIYIQSFKRLIAESTKCSQLRTRSNHVELQDVTQAMVLSGLVKPDNYLALDSNEEDQIYNSFSMSKVSKSAYNTKSLDSFINWIKYSDSFRISKRLNDLPTNLIKNLIEKRKLDLDDGETDQEKKKRKYKERQDYYNQLKLSDNTMLNDLDDDDELHEKDKLKWLNFLIEKDLKLGHDLKFLNTSLFDEFLKFQSNPKFHPVNNTNTALYEKYQQFRNHMNNANKYDYVLMAIEEKVAPVKPKNPAAVVAEVVEEEVPVLKPSEDLEKLLPYNLKYDKHLQDDSVEQFLEYVVKHKNPEIQFDTIQDNEFPNEDTAFVDDEGIGGNNNLMFL